MKSLLIFALLFPLQLLSQDLEGVWVGILHNDSTELDLHYEIVISEQKGKLTGYSYTNFIVDGRSYTGVKSLIINRRFGRLYVEDDKLIFNNYDFEPPKGVKQASILDPGTEEEMLSGRFSTTRTKQYGKPVTGHIYLLKKTDRSVSKLMEILNGLDLASNLSFIRVEQPVAAVELPKTQPVVKTKSPEPVQQVKETTVAKPVVVSEPTETKPAVTKTVTAAPKKIDTKTTGEPVTKDPVPNKPKETSAVSVPVVKEVAKPTLQQQLATRKIEAVQTIWFTSDSLVLELYDNGYVDGDSVSIVVNGKAFLTNLRLSEKAAVKTIHITPDMGDSVNLIMFAENLGTIYPNSGLAIIRDGKKEHRVAFSGDLQKNASIVLRRRRE